MFRLKMLILSEIEPTFYIVIEKFKIPCLRIRLNLLNLMFKGINIHEYLITKIKNTYFLSYNKQF